MTTMTEPATRTRDVPGAKLAYDVRSGGSGDAPVLLMIGSPMGAAGFGTLAGWCRARTVLSRSTDGSGPRSERPRRRPEPL